MVLVCTREEGRQDGHVDLLRAFLEALQRKTPDVGREEFQQEAEAMGHSLGLGPAQIRRVVRELSP